MSLYAPPENISMAEGLHLIFLHYCSPWKSALAETHGNASAPRENVQTMDGASFARMCREAPELDRYIGRTEIDLVFSKTKPPGIRRLDYAHFLDTLLELAVRIYPDEDPTIALANFLARFIFALFDQQPAEDAERAVDAILEGLALPDPQQQLQLQQQQQLLQQQQQQQLLQQQGAFSPQQELAQVSSQAQLYNPSLHSFNQPR